MGETWQLWKIDSILYVSAHAQYECSLSSDGVWLAGQSGLELYKPPAL